MRNIAEIVENQADLRPDACAVRTARGGQLTFRELAGVIERCALRLSTHGIRRGSIVGITVADELRGLAITLALARLEATSVTIRSTLPPQMRSDLSRECGLSLLVVDGKTSAVDDMRVMSVVGAAAPNGMTVHTAVVASDAPPAWTMIVGSGTTGRPRRFLVPHANEFAIVDRRVRSFEMSARDVVASLSTFEFTSAQRLALSALRVGGCVRFLDRRMPGLSAWIANSELTVLSAPVSTLHQLLASAPSEGTGVLFPKLRMLYTGASTVSDSLRAQVRSRLTPRFYVFYGMNEFGFATRESPDDRPRVPGSVGRPIDGVELEIVDGANRPVGPGIVGLVRVRAPAMPEPYLDDPKSNLRCMRAGWFYPMDLGRLAEDGQLVYCGRADDMMIFNGINVFPAEIEAVICTHPAVLDAVAVAVPHRVHQDIPACAVTLRPGQKVAASELRAYAAARLGSHAPQLIAVLRRIPRSEQGKVQRDQLLLELRAIVERRQHRSRRRAP